MIQSLVPNCRISFLKGQTLRTPPLRITSFHVFIRWCHSSLVHRQTSSFITFLLLPSNITIMYSDIQNHSWYNGNSRLLEPKNKTFASNFLKSLKCIVSTFVLNECKLIPIYNEDTITSSF